MSLRCLASSLGSLLLTFWEEMSYEDGGNLGYQNGTILANPNLYVAPMPPMKFQFSLTYGLGEMSFEDVHGAAILDIGMERF